MIVARYVALAVIGGGLSWGLPSLALAQTQPTSKDETPIKLSEVPQSVLAAARSELGAIPESAKIVPFEGQTAYEIKGTNKYDKHLSTVVTADGKVQVHVNMWEADDD